MCREVAGGMVVGMAGMVGAPVRGTSQGACLQGLGEQLFEAAPRSRRSGEPACVLTGRNCVGALAARLLRPTLRKRRPVRPDVFGPPVPYSPECRAAAGLAQRENTTKSRPGPLQRGYCALLAGRRSQPDHPKQTRPHTTAPPNCSLEAAAPYTGHERRSIAPNLPGEAPASASPGACSLNRYF